MTGARGRAAGLIALALGAAACSSGSAAPTGDAPVVEVTLRDFAIEAPASIEAGVVRFHVVNRGPETHEMVVVRAEEDGLTFRADGTTIDEEELEPITVGEVEGEEPGEATDWTAALEPGRYTLFCNMSGHFLGGMYTELEVR